MKNSILILITLLCGSLIITSCEKADEATPEFNSPLRSAVDNSTSSESSENDEELQSSNILQVLPSKFVRSTTIKYYVGEPAYVSIMIYNSDGRVVESITSDFLEAGEFSQEFDASDLPNGSYTARMWSRHDEIIKDFTKVSNADSPTLLGE